jgi:ATP-dependent DNA helicase RecQ
MKARSSIQRARRQRVKPERIAELLHETFGIKRLRPGQKAVIDNVLQGLDTLAVMPTGAGKSLCFQLPALLLPGITVVVSPLISLMQDQVNKLEQADVAVEQVNSTLNGAGEAAALQHIEQAETRIAYATPERMGDPDFIASLRQAGVDLFVVDEAHCITQWGHDFRPAYLELANAVAALGHPPVLALTATATAEVADDIKKQLGLPGMRVIDTGIYRRNLDYSVIQITNDEQKREEALRLVRANTGSGICYTATVKAAEELYEHLRENGEDVMLYHGRLNATERRRNQECFMQGDCRLMVATNAFGMGIDKDDVRFVVHYQMPANLETYYQESGRSGRDGQRACCTLLFDRKDKRVQQFFLAKHYPDADELKAVHQAVLALAAENLPASLAAIRDRLPDMAEGNVRVALKLLREGGALGQNRKFQLHARQQKLEPALLKRMAAVYEAKQERDREALEALVDYAQTGHCRWRLLLDYFDDEASWQQCGHCDNCRQPPEPWLMEAEEGALPEIEVHKPIEIAPGTAAEVARFGRGRVVDANGEQVTVAFGRLGEKTFLRRYVRIIGAE